MTDPAPNATPTAADPDIGAEVQQEVIDATNSTMPGGRAALPPGTLRPVDLQPQGDEHQNPAKSSPPEVE